MGRRRTLLGLNDNRLDMMLDLFAGATYEEIAERTGRSRWTIKNTVVHIRADLDVNSERIVDLMRTVLVRGIVSLPQIAERAIALGRSREMPAPPSRTMYACRADSGTGVVR
ncbi:MAG: hypothetical protein M3O36_07445, partial [Myxococcota bacterium]|nr:hypothetical protein [Myxococcota bacterium]